MVDTSQILFSDSFQITDKIKVRHPTLGDVLKIGEDRYFGALNAVTSIPSDAKSVLWDNGIDWMEISDLEYFTMIVTSMPKEDTELFLPGLDFARFKRYKRENGDVVFADKAKGIIIDKYVHMQIQMCLCTIHKIKKKVERAGNQATKEVLIEDDRERRQMAEAKKEAQKSTLIPLISSMVNREGFKYNYDGVKKLLFGQFLDAAARVQIITSTDQLIQGLYSGNVDMKKIDKKKLDWTRAV